ncbi:MAG TPA: acyl-ACP--UDP-N-acetylglucosamine O-acyltransferase [Kiritimatiellia bacterium]|nr:acyl-ACP--UDP-N-acetylglucosamine O-acyltransferase [Kiritimatiellia bacterium]
MPEIHPTALVASGANLADDVVVGPYCTVGEEVTIDSGTRLVSHVVVDGFTFIGKQCTIYPFAAIGLKTQDLKFKGGRPGVKIGSNNTLREYVTINAATYDGDFTTLGDHGHIMAYVHIAHDCHVGNRVIMANAATLAGHIVVEDQCIIGGLTGVHQFIKLGRLSIIGGCSKVVKDVPPFMMADGNPLSVHTINKLGLERAGISPETQSAMRDAYKIIYRENLTTEKALAKIQSTLPDSPEIRHLINFIQASERGITR